MSAIMHPTYTFSSVIPSLYCHLVNMKTKAFSRYVGVLVSLLSCAFSLFYFSQYDFRFPLHIHTTLVSGFIPNQHVAGKSTRPVVERPLARRPPSVEFIDIATNDTLSRGPYNTYPSYNDQAWSQRWHGSQQPCLGPRGVNVNSNPDDMLEARDVDPKGTHLVSSCSAIETYTRQSSRSRTHVWLLYRKWTR